jgi:PAS domain-containing protein
VNKKYSKIITNLYIYFIAFALLLNVVFIVVTIQEAKSSINKAGLKNTPQKTLERQKVFENFLKQLESTLLSIRQLEQFNLYIKDYHNIQNKKSLEKNLLLYAKSHSHIMQLRYIDKDGKEQMRIDRKNFGAKPSLFMKNQLQDKSKSYYFYESKTKQLEKVWFSNIDLNEEHGEIEKPFRPTLRAILPIELNGEFEGIIVVNTFIEKFLNSLLNAPLYDFKLINQKGEILQSNIKEESWGSYQDKKITLKDIVPHKYKKILSNEFYMDEKHASRILTKIDLPVKLIILLNVKEKHIEAGTKNIVIDALLKSIFILIISILLAYLFARKLQKVFDEFTKDEISYKEKIVSQSKYIQKSQETLSEHVLYSKTDLEGIITEVSDAFCKLSKYTKDEVIGRPHNLLRHPDMDRQVFVDLWETIQAQKQWKGEIKNLAKDGTYY